MSNRDRLVLSFWPLAGKAFTQPSRCLCVVLFVIIGLTSLVPAQAQKLRIVRVSTEMNDNFPKAIRFFCGNHYDQKDCQQHALSLRRVLAHYPVEQLGSWSFVLVPSADWTYLMTDAKSPGSPAFTEPNRRTTVFEEVLFSSRPSTRVAELLLMFGVPMGHLLELAVSHELGHALCHDKNEERTKTYEHNLRSGQAPVCYPSPSDSKTPPAVRKAR